MKSRQMGPNSRFKRPQEFYGLIGLVFQHGVICVKDQQLDLSDELLPCNVIKLPAQFAFNNVQPDLPQISRIGNIKPDGTLVPGVKNAEYWHQDGDFWGFPKSFLLNWLLSKEIPEQGGETGFLDLLGGYEQLDQEFQEKLEGGYFDISVRDIDDFQNPNPADFGLPDSVRHQAVYSHPILQKKHLYVGSIFNTLHLKNGEKIATKTMIQEIENNKKLSYYHKYQKGDLLIWDNTTTMHRSMGGFFDKPRLLYRGYSNVSQFHLDLYKKVIVQQ
ncbi:hypothetical protein pb186bvf_003300 [Paramecium bursaria]